MTTTTINGLATTATSIAAGDFLMAWRVAQGDTVKITKANAIGAVFTGGGTIATGGNTLTVGGDSTINGTLNAPGRTLSVTATGTAALIGTAQTFTAKPTFSAGINLGNEDLTVYDEGEWTPSFTFGNAAVGMTHSAQHGRYVKIGKLVFVDCDVRLSAKGSSAGTARLTGLPFAAEGNRSIGYVQYSSMTGTWKSIHVGTQTSSTILALSGATVIATSSGSVLSDTNFSDTTIFLFTLCYRAA